MELSVFFFWLKGKELRVDGKEEYFDLGLLYAPFWYQCLSTHKKKNYNFFHNL